MWTAIVFAAALGIAAPDSPGGTITGRVQNVVTGQYLSKARISVKGTDLFALTDDTGAYRLVNVPPGTTVLEAFFTGLDLQQAQPLVERGREVEQNFGLSSVARYGANPDVVKLQTFLVSADRETNGQAIAINEQRFAPNIKNVMATDSYGDIMANSVGEFLKFMPGFTAEYDGGDVWQMSMRGIGGAMTGFAVNGAPMANVFTGTADRGFDVRTTGLNDIARVEVTKVPTPSTAADSLAGSVNMISKSAFERSRAQLRFTANLIGDKDNLTFKKTPHTNGDKNTYKLIPGGDFDYTLPLGKTFGVVITGLRNSKYSAQHISGTTYLNQLAGTPASTSKPLLQTYTLTDSPRTLERASFGARADWRVTPNAVLSFGGQWNQYKTIIGAMAWTFNVGANAVPTPATGVPLTFGENFVIGASGRGAVTMSGGSQDFVQTSVSSNVNYRFDNGRWKVETGVTQSAADFVRDNQAHGHFLGAGATLRQTVRLTYAEINSERPGSIRAFDPNNQEVDLYNIANYRGTTANDNPAKNREEFNSAKLSIRHRLAVLPFPSSVEFGGMVRRQTRDRREGTLNWTFNGPAGDPNASLTPYLMQVYVNQDSHFGFKNIPWISANRTRKAFEANPLLYITTAAQAVANETSRLGSSEFISEQVSAGYVQAEANFLNNRLSVLTGVRFEQTTDKGEGLLFDPNAVFVRNVDGTFARNAAGARIRKPEAGSAGSLEELRLIRLERAYRAARTYDGYYPSFHVTYNVRENFLLRAAYARTYGRPNFSNIVPNATINEADLSEQQIINNPAIVRGTITVRNTNLRPWSADNYDLSVEYYTESGGVLSAGGFIKEINDFFGDSVRLATAADLQAVGLDQRYVGWNLSTSFNAGNARISGAEFNVRQSLRGIGDWGRYFTVFANGTVLRLEGNPYASFKSFIPRSGSWGASFAWRKLSLISRWNHRGLDKRGPQPLFGPEGFDYIKARTTLDVTAAYQLTNRLGITAGVNNVLGVPQTALRYGPDTPKYARQASIREAVVQFAVGVKGTF